jgi:hypothetical protein
MATPSHKSTCPARKSTSDRSTTSPLAAQAGRSYYGRSAPIVNWLMGERVADAVPLTESERNILGGLAQFGATALDQLWFLTCCRLKRTGLVSIYGRTARVIGEPEGKAFICLTPLGWQVVEALGLSVKP